MRTRIALGLGLISLAGAASAQSPLSAIDWLSDGLAVPEATVTAIAEPAVSGAPVPEVIAVTPLDMLSSDAVGLLPGSVTGLPPSLWGKSSSADLARALGALDVDMLPALRGLLFTLLLAELDPPADSDPSARLFLARVDTLLALGAVQQAQALLDRAGADTAAKFQRWFDTSLLTGTEDVACIRLRADPDLTPDLPSRIFCLARGGDWEAAALTLDTGRALGEISPEQDALMARFLDVEGLEEAPSLVVPARPDALEFRLFEAIGEALPTANLPLAYAHTDLGPNNGWKARINAAERLARSGAIDENQLLGLYTEGLPAASGGVWERAGAVQKFELALASRDPSAVSTALPAAWRALSGQSLAPVFANLYGGALNALPLSGDAAALAFRIGLLSPGYEKVATDHSPENDTDRFLIGLARGDLAGISPPDPVAVAIAEGFQASAAPEPLADLVRTNRLGEAILRAIAMAAAAAAGDLDQLPGALALFRSVGLEDTARRTGLQMLLLDTRG